DVSESVVVQFECDLCLAQLRGQPVVTVEVEECSKRTPRRNGQEEETEHLVDEVEVVVQALSGVSAQKCVAGGLVVPRLVRRTRLHRREDVHQTGMISALGEDLLDAIFLAEGLHLPDVLDRDFLFGCDLLCVSADGIPERLNELRVVEQAKASAVE